MPDCLQNSRKYETTRWLGIRDDAACIKGQFRVARSQAVAVHFRDCCIVIDDQLKMTI
jgi:hypothetical protein